MNVLFLIVQNTVLIFLSVLEFSILARAVLSLFMAEGLIIDILHAFTEPFLLPVRKLFEKLNLFQNMPLDFSGMVVLILISVAMILLP